MIDMKWMIKETPDILILRKIVNWTFSGMSTPFIRMRQSPSLWYRFRLQPRADFDIPHLIRTQSKYKNLSSGNVNPISELSRSLEHETTTWAPNASTMKEQIERWNRFTEIFIEVWPCINKKYSRPIQPSSLEGFQDRNLLLMPCIKIQRIFFPIKGERVQGTMWGEVKQVPYERMPFSKNTKMC